MDSATPITATSAPQCQICWESDSTEETGRLQAICPKVEKNGDHWFHPKCFREWVARSMDVKCPLCRIDIRDAISNSQDPNVKDILLPLSRRTHSMRAAPQGVSRLQRIESIDNRVSSILDRLPPLNNPGVAPPQRRTVDGGMLHRHNFRDGADRSLHGYSISHRFPGSLPIHQWSFGEIRPRPRVILPSSQENGRGFNVIADENPPRPTLQHAASVASLMLTTEAMVSDLPNTRDTSRQSHASQADNQRSISNISEQLGRLEADMRQALSRIELPEDNVVTLQQGITLSSSATGPIQVHDQNQVFEIQSVEFRHSADLQESDRIVSQSHAETLVRRELESGRGNDRAASYGGSSDEQDLSGFDFG